MPRGRGAGRSRRMTTCLIFQKWMHRDASSSRPTAIGGTPFASTCPESLGHDSSLETLKESLELQWGMITGM